MLTSLLVALGLLQAPAPATPAPDPPVDVAPGITLIRGAIAPGRGPDGNTIVLDGPDGLVVVDTGRHTYHSDAILALARARKRPIVAIVNTHWHLDHASGNRRLKAEYPKARVYTTRAIDRAIADGGFLTRDLDRVRARITAPDTPPLMKEEMEIFVATMDVREALRPDMPVETSGPMRLAGRPLDVRVTDNAITDADVWIYDAASRVAVLGDLVTVPVPYFETACPDRWTATLDEVWATPFETAIPGHGRPLTRPLFDAYRTSMKDFVACARSDRPGTECGAAWVSTMTPLIGDDAERRKAVASNIEYYVKYLRDGGGKAPDCRAR